MLLTDDGQIVEVVLDEPAVVPPPEPVDPRISYLLRKHHPDGQLAEEAIIINGNVEGIKKRWHSNGRMALRIGFRRGVPHGPRHMWSEDGKLLEEEFYVNGRLHGLCRKYGLNGKALEEANYSLGLLHGRSRVWFSDGQLQQEELFYRGLLNSTRREWHPNGNIKCIAEYKEGKLHGPRRYWYPDGQLVSEEVFENSFLGERLNGPRRVWHSNGQLGSEEMFVQGELNGISRYWSPDGRISSRASHVQGRLHGEQVEWDGAGRVAARTFYSRGVRIPRRYEILILHDRLMAKHILRIRNAEVRRVCLEALGYERFLAQMPHKVIHREGAQELVVIRWHDREEPVCLVKVRCPTTGAFYVLRVPPNMRRVKQAVAWTFGVNEKEYSPIEEA